MIGFRSAGLIVAVTHALLGRAHTSQADRLDSRCELARAVLEAKIDGFDYSVVQSDCARDSATVGRRVVVDVGIVRSGETRGFDRIPRAGNACRWKDWVPLTRVKRTPPGRDRLWVVLAILVPVYSATRDGGAGEATRFAYGVHLAPVGPLPKGIAMASSCPPLYGYATRNGDGSWAARYDKTAKATVDEY